ncbi:hypothetical protein [Phyllobacterium zundukense]|uniref:Lipoprotein n=1 Tax=Phyllobacterium zundukense TaxID=1867719 RepID=A0A2N9W1X4_9HYPH|nr:hypothetical protein [Phyllobacterium zundukense]ATU91488.1 hypothetical protein BLM14_07470 [Phyllobacterium zundukense]PIO45742.1 hypothetical protein B5P45_07065 [Phyllobacterium zundukense]
MKVLHIVASCLVALMLLGCTVSENRYKQVQASVRNPAQQKAEIANCSTTVGGMSRELRQTFATLAGTSVASVPTTFCKRIVQGVASGKLSRDDINSVYKGSLTPNALKVIQGR